MEKIATIPANRNAYVDECGIDKYIFETWFEQRLLPTLPEKTVILMDNATFRRKRRLNAILDKTEVERLLKLVSMAGAAYRKFKSKSEINFMSANGNIKLTRRIAKEIKYL